MRALSVALVAVCASVALAAQVRVPNIPVPRDLPLPNLGRLLRGGPPLTTSLKDARRDVPFLDAHERKFSSMAPLRNSRGTFTLRPGHWTIDLQSFCLRPGTRGPQPTDGRGYLVAPLAGPQAGIISHMLLEYGRLTDIPQRDMQTLLWAVLSRTKISQMNPQHRALAARVLTPAQMAALESGAIDVIPPSARRRIFDALPREVRALAEAENRVRDLLYRANYTYDELERAAILTGPPGPAPRIIPTTRWSVHPSGFLMRMVPHGIARTTVQIARPPRYQVRRDARGRIVSLEFADGRRTETEYDDSIPAFTPPGNLHAVGYAFKSVKLTRPGANGRREEIVVQGKGWTFVTRPAARLAPQFGFARVSSQPWLERFQEWKERYDEWNEEYAERAEYYRDIWEDATDPPPSVEQVLRDLEDLEHYRDGIEAALTGDVGDRLEWLIDHQDRMNDALERATLVLSGLPDRSDAERDLEWVPPYDVPTPASTDDQRGGLSGRSW